MTYSLKTINSFYIVPVRIGNINWYKVIVKYYHILFTVTQNVVFGNSDVHLIILMKDLNFAVLYSKALFLSSIHRVASYIGVRLLYIATFMYQIDSALHSPKTSNIVRLSSTTETDCCFFILA